MSVSFFNNSVVENYRLFYVLDHITDTSVEIYRRTPAGDDPFEDADVFIMDTGHLLIALRHPFSFSGNMCLVAKTDDTEEFINLNPWERLVDVYNTDIENTDQGHFAFTNSRPIFEPESEWRCDNTMFGPRPFFEGPVAPTMAKLKAYEPILSAHGIGYLVYIHLENDEVEREKFKNDAEIPCSGLTLSEVFKLMYEWSEVTKEPFNNTEDIAVKSNQFLETFGFSYDLIDNQVDMQVTNYLTGSNTARLRPEGVQPNKEELIRFIQKRMASSSLAFIHSLYPELTQLEGIVVREKEELDAGILRFKEFYQIPLDWPITDSERIVEHCVLNFHSTIGTYVHNQLRLFRNKKLVLDGLSDDAL
jgi:hypothetical protein